MASATPSPVTPPAPAVAAQNEHVASAPTKPRWPWLKYLTPVLVLLLAAAVIITMTRDWNAWEGGRIEQVTDDAELQPVAAAFAASNA